MRTRRLAASCGIALLALTGCGEAATDTAEQSDSSSSSSGAGSAGSGGTPEKITPGGIAVVVLDHLGDDAVREVSTFGSEPGSVSVMVTLRDRTPHNFSVQVHSPEMSGNEFGKAGACPPKRRLMGGSCQVLDGGTTVTTSRTPYGFSDDNPDGVVVMGTSVTDGNGVGMAMYESYDDSPAVSTADIAAILGDPRLVWRTAPAVNEAGADVKVRERAG